MSATMDIQSITKSISTMEAQLGELRKIVTMMGMGGQAAPVVTEKVKKERKPRSADAKPNPWIDFTKLVRAALVPAVVEKLGAECQQFCKTLKSEQADYASWTPEAIQTRWRTWEKPAKAPTPPASDTEAPAAAAAAPSDKPKRVLTDEQKAKMKAGREAAKARKAAEAGSSSEAPAAVSDAPASDGEASTSSKKRGRPKGSKNKAPAESVAVAVAVIAEEYKPLTLGGKKYLLSGDRAYQRTGTGEAGTYVGVYDAKTKSFTA
jgi:hypothetical protein